MYILVIDAQGGGIGRQLVSEIKSRKADLTVHAVGTNASATQASSTRPSFGMRPRRALTMRVTATNATAIRKAARARISMCCVRYLMETMFRPQVAITNINCR